MNRHEKERRKKAKRVDRAEVRRIAWANRPRLSSCSKHGATQWTGQVICTKCDRILHLDVDHHESKCVCGAELVGRKGSARAICAVCFDDRKKADEEKIEKKNEDMSEM